MPVPISSARRRVDLLNREASITGEKKATGQFDESSNRVV